jgi:replicative DNA helicase
MAEIIIAKHRNGALENVKLKFIGQFAKFENFSDDFGRGEGNAMQPNDSFDEATNSVILGSKFNDDAYDYNDGNDDNNPPF